MKNLLKKIILLILFVNISHSQVTTTVDQVFVNNQTTVNLCNTINLASNQSVNLVFYYTLTKPSSQAVGDGTVRILLKNTSSSFPTEKVAMSIPASFWSPTQYQSTISCNIGANEIQVSGSTIFVEYTSAGNVKYQSCENPIIKNAIPTFTLSQSTVSVGCNDLNPRTFSVTAANIPAGANVVYQWSALGWSGTSNTSSITLAPSSPASASILLVQTI
ncbi:hypothetical protein WFZ85_04515 [Flavobacterium sp. j3]|uniref:Uncharacterized protein n=1 Tax=Flavobacterium aureirubrum TaxID=3133147 RepID=A0ABU9N5M1_9FLAO